MQHIATSQLVYTEIQFTGFYVIQAFTKGFFRKDFKTAIVLWMPLDYSLGMVYVFRSCMLPCKIISKMFQLFALSITVVLFLIWQILNFFKLKELLSTLNKSMTWL